MPLFVTYKWRQDYFPPDRYNYSYGVTYDIAKFAVVLDMRPTDAIIVNTVEISDQQLETIKDNLRDILHA